MRPARAAQRQHGGLGFDAALAVRRREAQRAVGVPAQPAVAHMEDHAVLAQPVQPGAQQRRGFQILRKDPARAADESGDAQARGPLAQCLRRQRIEPARHLHGACAVARNEFRQRLAVRQIQPPFAGEQELAADRGHRIEQLDPGAGLRQRLGRHQAGRATADDCRAAWRWRGASIGHVGGMVPWVSGSAASRDQRLSPGGQPRNPPCTRSSAPRLPRLSCLPPQRRRRARCAKRAVRRSRRRWSSSIPPRAAARARRPTAGCRR